MANEYSINAKITADSTGFEKGIKSAQNSLKGFSSSISSAMKLAGGLFAVGSIAQLGKALSDMAQSYAKATQNIVRGTGAVGDQLKTLQKSVNASLINGVGRDASELGEMVADLNTRLGVTGDTLTELVGQFDDFSDVTGTDTKTAINSVSDVLAKWNIEASQTVPLLDQLTAASQASGASVTELTNGLKSGQAVFSQFGMSATESIAFLGTLKKNGIDTSSAIMGMKTALANFAKSGLDAKTAFAEISESIKNAGSQTKALSIATQTFGQRNGAEFVRILSGGTDGVDAFTEALENAGGTLERTNEASRTSADALKDLKATIAGVFATSGTDNGLRDLIDDVAKAIRSFDFSSIKETFSNIGLFIQGVWEQFKALFNNLSGAVDIAGGNFKIFADIIYQNLNNAYKVLQDFVGMISAILNGDWSVAWEYAKLIVLRTVKQMEESVNNAIRLMPNLFNSVIEGYNWVLEQQDKLFLDIFHLPEKYFKSAKLPKFEGKDLIDTKSIEEAIEEVRKTIESKTGKIADKNLSDLKKQKEAVHNTTQSITADIGSLGTAVEDTTETAGTKITDFFAEWGKQYEDLAGNWNKTFVDMANVGTKAMGDMFETIGQGLVDNGIGYEDFASIAVASLSEVLKGLAAQLSALAAVNAATFNYGKAALAAAGAAAALVAAGTLKAVSNSLKKVDDTAKSANISLDEFVKRIQNIKETSFSKLGTFDKGVLEYTSMISEATKEMKKAYEEYDRLRNELPAVSERFAKLYYSDLLKKIENAYNTYKSWSEKVVQGNKDLVNSFINLAKSSQNIVKENSAISHSYQELFKSINEVAKLKSTYKEDWFKYMILMGSGDPTETKFFQYQKYSVYLETLTNNIKAQVQDMANEVYESMLSVGKDIGETFVSSIVDGVKKEDFMLSIKDYMKKQMTKLVVLTDEFSDKIAGLGLKLISAMTSEDSKEPFEEIKNELSSLYDEAETKAKAVESVLTEVFGEVKESTGEATLSIAELKAQMAELYEGRTAFKIAKDNSFLGFHIIFKKNQLKEAIDSQKEAIEEVIRSYYESLETVGSSMAGIISSGFKEGLSKEDLKLSIKEWIRNQLIESTVYEVYQKKLAEIGAEIAGYMTHGQADYLGQVSKQIDSIYDEMTKTLQSIDSVLDQTFGVKMEESAESVGEELEKIEESYTKFEKSMKDFSDTISDLGGDVASNFISSLNSGLDVDSALISFKKFVRNYIVQAAVYTESLKTEMESLGKGIADYISGKKGGLDKVGEEFKKTYEKLAANIKKTDEYLDKLFGKEEQEQVEKTTETIEENLSRIQKAMNSFKDTVSDLGGDIASNLIDGLSNGLSQSDFLTNMKNWIKKMLVQSVVYTEQMKSQIEEIGKAISSAISGGFTETSMHEIRRDLSFIFEQATSKMSGIDRILGGVFDGYATGTTSALSGLHIVGERGPELVRFNGGERVYNNADTMKMIAGAGKTNNFNVTFNNLQDTSAFAMMSQLKQYNREMAINGIL